MPQEYSCVNPIRRVLWLGFEPAKKAAAAALKRVPPPEGERLRLTEGRSFCKPCPELETVIR